MAVRRAVRIRIFLGLLTVVLACGTLALGLTLYRRTMHGPAPDGQAARIPGPSAHKAGPSPQDGRVLRSSELHLAVLRLIETTPGMRLAGVSPPGEAARVDFIVSGDAPGRRLIAMLETIASRSGARVGEWETGQSGRFPVRIALARGAETTMLRVGFLPEKAPERLPEMPRQLTPPRAPAATDRVSTNLRKHGSPVGPPRIAIVLDDAGGDSPYQWLFLGLTVPFTFAVLPDLANSTAFAVRAREAGHGVFLHVPMLPLAAERNAQEERLLRPGMARREVFRMLDGFFRSVPGAGGANNHMGSLATQDHELMGFVMEYLKGRRLLFLDSRTTPASVAVETARHLRLPVLARDVFLDHDADRESVRKRLLELAALARSRGFAVGIGHVTRLATLEALRDTLPELIAAGIRVVPLKELY